ncbi:MAG: MarR family transcriptional regulator [Microthrixaceae bacterium]|nr:MarR family transcriptional regulator [Microthrixaceae bacterium]
MADPKVVEIAGSLRFLIARLNRQLRQQDDSGLSPSLGAALATIAREGPMTLGALAAAEQVSAPTVTKLVDKLADRLLVVRQVDPNDRRVCRVQLTATGRRRLDAARTRRTEWLASRLGELAPDDLRRVAEAVAVLESIVAPTPTDTTSASPP